MSAGTGDQTILSTLDRGLSVLGCVVEHGPINAKRIRRELGLRSGTCYHILRTLVSTGHLTRLDDGTYDVGAAAFALSRRIGQRVEMPPELNVILARLHTLTGETTYYSRWVGGAVVLQNYLAGTQPINVGRLEVGFGGALHARASSKAIIAQLPHEQVETLFKGVALAALTPATITHYDELIVELAQVRSQGYAFDREEFAEGVTCVAACVVAAGAPIGAYTISVPTSRFAVVRTNLIAAVVEAASMATRMVAAGRCAVAVPHDTV